MWHSHISHKKKRVVIATTVRREVLKKYGTLLGEKSTSPDCVQHSEKRENL